MKLNSLEIADKKATLIHRNLELVKLAKTEVRELTEDEEKEFKANEEEVNKLDEELKALEAELEKEDPKEDPKDDETRNLNKNISRNKMEKYNLIKELRNAMETGKSIELRSYDVASEGADVVATDLYSVLEPIREKNVLVQAGAKFMTGLVGDVQVPVMGAGQVFWAGETAPASDGSGSFTSVNLSPKRLTAKFPISLQFLAQDSVNAEAAIRADIANAINAKLEATILGTGAGDANTPEGLFSVADDAGVISSFADLCAAEAKLDGFDGYADAKYILAPTAKAALRGMIKGTNGTGMVYENGAVDGVEALTTAHVGQRSLLYGCFDQLIIGQWGNIMIDVVRDSASLVNGCVTIVVNCFFDAEVARPEAIVKATL